MKNRAILLAILIGAMGLATGADAGQEDIQAMLRELDSDPRNPLVLSPDFADELLEYEIIPMVKKEPGAGIHGQDYYPLVIIQPYELCNPETELKPDEVKIILSPPEGNEGVDFYKHETIIAVIGGRTSLSFRVMAAALWEVMMLNYETPENLQWAHVVFSGHIDIPKPEIMYSNVIISDPSDCNCLIKFRIEDIVSADTESTTDFVGIYGPKPWLYEGPPMTECLNDLQEYAVKMGCNVRFRVDEENVLIGDPIPDSQAKLDCYRYWYSQLMSARNDPVKRIRQELNAQSLSERMGEYYEFYMIPLLNRPLGELLSVEIPFSDSNHKMGLTRETVAAIESIKRGGRISDIRYEEIQILKKMGLQGDFYFTSGWGSSIRTVDVKYIVAIPLTIPDDISKGSVVILPSNDVQIADLDPKKLICKIGGNRHSFHDLEMEVSYDVKDGGFNAFKIIERGPISIAIDSKRPLFKGCGIGVGGDWPSSMKSIDIFTTAIGTGVIISEDPRKRIK
jgi:hypothetical protein